MMVANTSKNELSRDFQINLGQELPFSFIDRPNYNNLGGSQELKMLHQNDLVRTASNILESNHGRLDSFPSTNQIL